MKKTPVYLGLLVLEISKMVMYQFWYDQAKPKYGEKSNLWYMDTTNFIVCIKTEDIYSDPSKDVKKRFDTSNYKLDRPLPKGKNKKVTGLIKDELDGKMMKEFAALSAKKPTMMKIKIAIRLFQKEHFLERTQLEKKDLMWIVFDKIKKNL